MPVSWLFCGQGQARFPLLSNSRVLYHAQATVGTNFIFPNEKEGTDLFSFQTLFSFHTSMNSISKSRSYQVTPLINLKAMRNLWRNLQIPQFGTQVTTWPAWFLFASPQSLCTPSPSNQTFQWHQTVCCFMVPGLPTWILHSPGEISFILQDITPLWAFSTWESHLSWSISDFTIPIPGWVDSPALWYTFHVIQYFLFHSCTLTYLFKSLFLPQEC